MKRLSLISILLYCFVFSNTSIAEQTVAPTEQNAVSAEQKSSVTASPEKNINQINTNTASAEEMAHSLDGIGINKAKRIIEYRDKFGPFVSIEQIKEVSGIGKGTLERNIEKLTL